MRLLHTSDWHLGQHFMGKSRFQEHQAFLDWLLTQITAHQVDSLIIAGDIFDTGTPPSYARQQYLNFVVEAQRAGCQLVVLGGNHDAVSTLEESRGVLACLNTEVIAGRQPDLSEHLLTLKNRQGEEAALFCALPFLRPRDLVSSQAGDSAAAKQQATRQALKAIYQQLFTLAEAQRKGRALPIIGSGHLTTLGGQTSDSEREIYIGTLDAFPASDFPAFDYLALGHLHRPQQVAGKAHSRYSGSPLPLSFNEGLKKEVLLVEFSAAQLQQITPLDIPCSRALYSMSCQLDELVPRLAKLIDTRLPLPAWLDIEILDEGYRSDLQQRIADLLEALPVEVLKVRRGKVRQTALLLEEDSPTTLEELNPHDVFGERLAREELTGDSVTQLKHRFAEVLDALENSDNNATAPAALASDSDLASLSTTPSAAINEEDAQ